MSRQHPKNYKILYNKRCIDCGVLISPYHSIRCRKCNSKLKRGSNSPHWKGGIGKCIECGQQLSTYGKIRCKSCAGKRRPKNYGSKHNTWKGGKPKCEICGEQLNHYYTKKCFECYVKALGGPTHHRWKGGKSFEPYPLGWNKTFKEQIRYRDGYRCQICNVPEIECDVKLHVHHKDYNKKNIKPENLVSLCNSCHAKTNHNQEYWKKYFDNIKEINHESCSNFHTS